MKNVSFTSRSNTALAIVGLFVLFLTASAPHRVHHLLENISFPSNTDLQVVRAAFSEQIAPTFFHRPKDTLIGNTASVTQIGKRMTEDAISLLRAMEMRFRSQNRRPNPFGPLRQNATRNMITQRGRTVSSRLPHSMHKCCCKSALPPIFLALSNKI